MTQDGLKKIENWHPDGKRKPRKPKTRWNDDITVHGSIFWRRKALNRNIWQNLGNTFTQYSIDLKGSLMIVTMLTIK
jgi:hypothetical protein